MEIVGPVYGAPPVVTAGGMHGKIAALQDEYITLEIAPGVKVKYNRSAVMAAKRVPMVENPTVPRMATSSNSGNQGQISRLYKIAKRGRIRTSAITMKRMLPSSLPK